MLHVPLLEELRYAIACDALDAKLATPEAVGETVKANDAIMLIRSNRKAPPRAAKPKPSAESLAKRQRREAHEAYDAARRAAFVVYDAAKRKAYDSYDAEVRRGNDEPSSYAARDWAMRQAREIRDAALRPVLDALHAAEQRP